MNILLGIGYLALIVFNIILYHKIFNVVYFDLGQGILKELIGAIFVSAIEIGLIGKYVFHIDWEDIKEDNNSIEYNIEDQDNTDSDNTYESSTNMNTIDKNSMDVDYTDYDYLVADNEKKYGNMAYFALADIDNDGIEELIIEGGTCDTDIVNEVYTLINNEAEYLGEFEGNADLYMAKNSYGIYASYENMGNVITYYVEKDGNFLNLSEIKNGKTKRDIDFSKKIEWETLSGNNSNSEEQEQEDIYDDYYIFAESDSRFLKDSELENCDAETLRFARNEIYARYGRKFHDSVLQDYFDSMPWYTGTVEPEEFNESILNKYEKKNLKKIVQYENK